MDKSRLDTSRSGYREDVSNHSKKNKKRSSKRSSVLGSWMNSMQNNQNNDTVSGMEYQHVLWQSNVQQNIPNNGQRLFTTTSDPSMCGYAQMPMTYTMEPVSLPTMYRLYQPVPFSGVRPVHGRPRRHCNQNHPMNLGMNSMANGYTSLQENGMESPVPINYQNGDYASLPPTANKNNGMNGDELNSEHRRYSDPGLGSAEAPVHAPSEDSDSVDSGSSITTIGRGNKLVLSLIEQMTELKKSNSQLFKELNETKSELGSMKAKLAQCKYSNSTDYQPGMLSDFIREIRQANKACEEGLVSKVMSMVEEKLNQRSLEMVNLNNQIMKLMEEKEESDRRIAKLEEEVATLKLNANSPTPMDASWTMDDRDQVTSSGNRSPVVVTNTQDTRDAALEETSNIVNLDIPSSDKAEDCKQQEDDQSDVQSNDKTLENTKNNNEVIVPTADENQIDSTVENSPELNSGTISSSVVSSEKRTKVSKKEDYYHQHQHQRMGSKKQRKKKNGSLLAKRSFSEADKAAATETLKNGTRDVRRTVSEDKDRLDGDVDETSRAITEIPEVTVVGGGSFVPKDLCSTGILTSRVLTAPSRATYTTAYI
ncbi:PREDICTED: uncharacterized protein LOC108576102 isoform X2 [Habropoda laboriosa]|uniref:uncharacterized protein LOC108576102 isoform X2 n=1 Tax=Habropoda laboriosa TaxID=597456 RepID=UPI00083CC20B|nr:PREDICTED: uncharacterized protein LOC108576102 isoform X2 [Habropoda laboriosa]